MPLRPINAWLPQTVGLLASTILAIRAAAPPGHPYTWLQLVVASATIVFATSLTCATAMFLLYVALPKPDPGPFILRTSSIAACIAPLVILLQQRSLWTALITAFIVWTLSPVHVTPRPQWKKFAGSLAAAVLLQIGIAASLGDQARLATLILGIAAAPILWRIRQERDFRGPFQPKWTLAIALLLAIFGLTAYLPLHSGGSAEAGSGQQPSSGAKPVAAAPGLSHGGKYRGVILMPEEEQHIVLVPPLPMMGRDPFKAHKDPIGIPFYGVYWFFQSPDKSPNEDAYRTKGTPDNVTFRSADFTPLKMEAHQNLGRLIDVSSCSRIDVAIRNADFYGGAIGIELLITNTSLMSHPSQSLGQVQVTSRPAFNEIVRETLSFRIPPASIIQQFDELTIRFPRAPYRATRSARIAIERFFLVPRK